MNRDIYIALPLMALLLVIQASILPRFPLLGTVPNLLLVTAVAWALLRGQTSGLVWAFIAGVALDLFSAGPMGVSAFTLVLTLFLVSLLHENIPSNPFFSPLFLGALATVIFLLFQGILLQILGYVSLISALGILTGQIVANTIAILPIYWLLFAGVRTLERRQIRLEL